MKKPLEKVAYLSRNSVVSEIFHLLPNSPNGRIHVFQMWSIEQLYIELGFDHLQELCNSSPNFGGSFNPISTRRGKLYPPHLLLAPPGI